MHAFATGNECFYIVRENASPQLMHSKVI